MRDRLLCAPYVDRQYLIDKLSNELERSQSSEQQMQFVEPVESSSAPLVAIDARLRILLKAYKDEYHADVVDVKRLAERIGEGRELIWFCGEASNVERLKRAIGDKSVVEEGVELGTMTVISLEEEFGLGYGEACRYGSAVANSGARAVYMRCAHELMVGASPLLGDRYHTLISTTRNRVGTETIAGGEAVHKIARDYVDSRFWGYAPWYVMPGDVLELLELREVNRDPADVRTALLESSSWHFADPDEAAFATALVRLNFDVHIPHQVAQHPTAHPSTRTFWCINPPSEELMRYNHGALIELSDTDRVGVSLSDGIERLEKLSVSCAVVYVSLDDQTSLPAQEELRSQGFRLSAIIPPKKTWVRLPSGQRRNIDTAAIGIWSRPRTDLSVEPPYYFDTLAENDDERVVIDYARRHLLQD